MKKICIVMSALAVALMITLSSYAACPCQLSAPAATSAPCCETPKPCCVTPAPCCETPKPCCETPKPCCETPKPCCETPKPCCETPKPCCEKPATCGCCPKCQSCNKNIIDLDKACGRNSYEVIAHSQKLSKFERIIKQAGMEDYYTCGNYIAFVPVNCALGCVKFKCADTAKKFVLEHLADAKCYPNELCTYPTIKTLCGKEFCISQECSTTRIGKSVVIVDNVKTQNGRIYVLDRKLK